MGKGKHMRNHGQMPALLALCSCLLGLTAAAQTVRVDLSHSTNSFVPTKTLGAGVDRIPVKAIDDDLNPVRLSAPRSIPGMSLQTSRTSDRRKWDSTFSSPAELLAACPP